LYETVLSPAERGLYETECRSMRHAAQSAHDGAGALNDADACAPPPIATTSTLATTSTRATTPELAPPTSVALWFQQPMLQPEQCAEPTRRVAAKLTSPHPLSVASIDAALPNATYQDIVNLGNDFKKNTGGVPGPHPGFPKHVRYYTCCCELCSKRAPLPHAYQVGLGLVTAFRYIMKVMGGHSHVNDTDTVLVI
jgi:hypothetical protein